MKFSILIPCYKCKTYIDECLKSVLAQKYEDWECVCIDDGSPDNTLDILKKYAAEDPRFRVFTQKNSGPTKTRENCLRYATGEWVTFLDNDDIVSPDWLLTYATVIRRESPNLLKITGVSFEDGSVPVFEKGEIESITLASKSEIAPWGWKVMPSSGYCWCYAVKREIINKIKFYDGVTLVDDVPIALQYLNFVDKVILINNPLYYYRQRTGSIMSTKKWTTAQTSKYLGILKEICGRQSQLISSLPNKAKEDTLLAMSRYLWGVVMCSVSLSSDRNDIQAVRDAICDFRRFGFASCMKLKLQWIIPCWLFAEFGTFSGIDLMFRLARIARTAISR